MIRKAIKAVRNEYRSFQMLCAMSGIDFPNDLWAKVRSLYSRRSLHGGGDETKRDSGNAAGGKTNDRNSGGLS